MFQRFPVSSSTVARTASSADPMPEPKPLNTYNTTTFDGAMEFVQDVYPIEGMNTKTRAVLELFVRSEDLGPCLVSCTGCGCCRNSHRMTVKGIILHHIATHLEDFVLDENEKHQIARAFAAEHSATLVGTWSFNFRSEEYIQKKTAEFLDSFDAKFSSYVAGARVSSD